MMKLVMNNTGKFLLGPFIATCSDPIAYLLFFRGVVQKGLNARSNNGEQEAEKTEQNGV